MAVKAILVVISFPNKIKVKKVIACNKGFVNQYKIITQISFIPKRKYNLIYFSLFSLIFRKKKLSMAEILI